GRASIAGDPCEARVTGRASIAGDPCEARVTGRRHSKELTHDEFFISYRACATLASLRYRALGARK
ncbi:MAG: hypothetical protein KDB14_05445, partial [Planctomycetales bacterium]|nr:hypothetical protein [Planctomycetales bacterium]